MDLSRATATATAAAVALSSALLIAGCGSSDSAASGGSTSTPSSSSQNAAIAWADGVCSASTALGQSVRDAGKALQLDPTDPATSVDQARAQAGDRIAAVRQAAASLDSAVSAVPAGADPQLVAARQQLQTASQRVRGTVDQLGTAVGNVTDAGTATEVASSLVALKAALAGTANDLAAFHKSLSNTVDGAEQAVRSTFGAAPACQELPATATTA